MIKVANIIEDGRIGGPHLRIINVAKSLPSDEFHTTVVIPWLDSNNLAQKLVTEGIDFKATSLHRLTLDVRHLFYFILLFVPEVVMLMCFFRRMNFDIVHVSGGSWQWKGVIAGRLAGCRVLWHLNDTSMPRIIQLIFKVLAKLCCDGFILAGKRVEEYYLEALGVKKDISFIIQAPVSCSLFDPKLVEPDPDISSDAETKIVTVANVNRIKGMDTFISMAKEVSAVRKDVKFYIVGPVYDTQKSYHKKLLNQIEEYGLENIMFYGPSSNVRGILAAADIYVCSSLAEASPISVWEAMAMEKPIVSTNVGDVPYYIKHGYSGFLCDVGDSKAMADLVSQLVGNDSLRDCFGREARKIALEKFDLSRCVENHAEVYRATMKAFPISVKAI